MTIQPHQKAILAWLDRPQEDFQKHLRKMLYGRIRYPRAIIMTTVKDEVSDLQILRDTINDFARLLEHGCGNHGCRIKKPTGLGTNASCRCSPRQLANQLLQLSVLAEQMKL